MSAITTILNSKRLSAVVMAVIVLMLAGLTVLSLNFFLSIDHSIDMPMFLDGEYSVDGGEFKPYSQTGEITDSFNDKVVFKGKLSTYTSYYPTVTISSKNVWYNLKNSKGEVVYGYNYKSEADIYEEIFSKKYDEKSLTKDERELLDIHKKMSGLAMQMPNTPGYQIEDLYFFDVATYNIDYDEVLTFEVINPYDSPQSDFSDCLDVVLSESNGKYTQFIAHTLPYLVLFMLVCFFGLFFFPVAGFILGRVDYKYLSFGALCFFWGLFMIMRSSSSFLNLWITDPTVCLLINALTNYFFISSLIFYFKTNLEKPVSHSIAMALWIAFVLGIITVTVLHFTGVSDVHVTLKYMMALTAICGLAMPILLFYETRYGNKALYVLISWIPLAVCVLVDAINHYSHFTDFDFYVIGLALTMVYQIVRLVFDLRRQYKEAIKYQKMQKELYEAKVSVMVSQIQPHFMYNALSSIAMLCKINPDTAYNATITFSDYLRGNMDSLKQKAPVPFEKELEHLKKYLYIEQLRFGKKLNIEYDIQTTDFVLPQLSIQPLVENAVKHGVGMKKKGGTVTISTEENDDFYMVIISDDGVGFDTEQKKNDGRSHVGMENTRRRLKELCNAEVIITSVVGEGTVATVLLPKEDQKK